MGQVLGLLWHLAQGAALRAQILARATNPNILRYNFALLVRDGFQVVPGNAVIEEGLDLACAANTLTSISSCSIQLTLCYCNLR